MKKPYRQADGFYHVDGKKYKTLFGSREQVMNGTVHKTTGGLTKADLVMNKWGRIVSAKKFKTAKKEMRLQKHGFFAKKGKFGAITRKFRGGNPTGTVNTASASTVVDPTVVTTTQLPRVPPVVDPAVPTTPPAATTLTPVVTTSAGGANSGAKMKTKSLPKDENKNIIIKQKSSNKKKSSPKPK